MWNEVHWNRLMEKWALYTGTTDGYKITRLYTNRLTAKLSAKIHGYRFCE